MDVKGGLLLGFAVAIMAGPLQVCNAFDQFMLQTPYVGFVAACDGGSCLGAEPTTKTHDAHIYAKLHSLWSHFGVLLLVSARRWTAGVSPACMNPL